MTTRRHLGKDIALYVVISYVVCVIVIVCALSELPEPLIMKCFGAFLFTAFVFGFLIEKTRASWNRKLFWAWAASLLVLHCVVLAMSLSYGVAFEKTWWVFGVEAFFLIQLTKLMFRRDRPRPAHPR